MKNKLKNPEYYIFLVDDGARHYIAARGEAEAAGMYFETMWRTWDEWPKKQPAFKKLPATEVLDVYDDDSGRTRKWTAARWATSYGERAYIACSDWQAKGSHDQDKRTAGAGL